MWDDSSKDLKIESLGERRPRAGKASELPKGRNKIRGGTTRRPSLVEREKK